MPEYVYQAADSNMAYHKMQFCSMFLEDVVVVKQFKRNKVPWPNKIAMFLYKYMDDDNPQKITDYMNIMWNNETITEEMKLANVCSKSELFFGSGGF